MAEWQSPLAPQVRACLIHQASGPWNVTRQTSEGVWSPSYAGFQSSAALGRLIPPRTDPRRSVTSPMYPEGISTLRAKADTSPASRSPA